jgi:hypothetical protein
MRSHWATTALGMVATMAIQACQSNSSNTKELTESSARPLIQTAVAESNDLIPMNSVVRLFAKTRLDYKSFDGDGPGGILRKLLDKGLVAQTDETISYPKISGVFSEEIHNPGQMRYDPECLTKYEYQLEANDKSDSFSGKSITIGCNGSVIVPGANTDYHHGSFAPDKPVVQYVNGIISSDGSVVITPIDARGNPIGRVLAKYSEDGPAAYLTIPGMGGPHAGQGLHLTGKATGQKIDLRWYSYSFTPKGKQQVESGSSGTEAHAGKIKVGVVSDLQLVSDTNAAARFAWTAEMTDLGNLLTGNKGDSGVGAVMFTKKPDGSWFVARWSLR